VTEENDKIRNKLEKQGFEMESLSKARDSFKNQFLELREINKDLK
jgi:hypothetical protein